MLSFEWYLYCYNLIEYWVYLFKNLDSFSFILQVATNESKCFFLSKLCEYMDPKYVVCQLGCVLECTSIGQGACWLVGYKEL